MSKLFDNGGLIGVNSSITPLSSKGVWNLNTVRDAVRQLLWPRAPGEGGQQSFTSPGTYVWTAPLGVTSVCVVCVGGGGGGANYFGSGGAGGGLAWKNNIPVTPGQNYTVVVGIGGPGLPSGTSTTVAGGTLSANNGGNSSFSAGAITVTATGGQHGCGVSSSVIPPGGIPSNSFDGGGAGGIPRIYSSAIGDGSFGSAGGGGAGGYSGDGGIGAGALSGGGTYVAATAGTGGGGGGGAGMATSIGTNNYGGAGGGGVGILGLGSNGSAGVTDLTSATPDSTMGGGGGSGGSNGSQPLDVNNGGSGGTYGGGGGSGNGDQTTSVGGAGASGAVRIIWGNGRAFPNVNTADL